MKNHFEDKIKEKMNQLSVEESGLNPDMDAVWDKIKNKNNSASSKNIKFKSTISHAAAVLVGIIISATLLFSIFDKKKVGVTNDFATVDLQKPEPSKTIIKIDTVFIVKTIVKDGQVNNLAKITMAKQVIDNTEIAHNNTISPQNNNDQVGGGGPQQWRENVEKIQENAIALLQSSKAAKPKKIIYWSDIQSNYHNTASEQKQNLIAKIMNPGTQENESTNNTTTNSPFLAFSKSFRNN